MTASNPAVLKYFVTLRQFLQSSSESERKTLRSASRVFGLKSGKVLAPLCEFTHDNAVNGIVYVVADSQPLAECYTDIEFEYVKINNQ
jgi:hypothetical protein